MFFVTKILKLKEVWNFCIANVFRQGSRTTPIMRYWSVQQWPAPTQKLVDFPGFSTANFAVVWQLKQTDPYFDNITKFTVLHFLSESTYNSLIKAMNCILTKISPFKRHCQVKKLICKGGHTGASPIN